MPKRPPTEIVGLSPVEKRAEGIVFCAFIVLALIIPAAYWIMHS